MSSTLGEQYRELNDFLQELLQFANGGSLRVVSKTKCQQMKEHLNGINDHVKGKTGVSAIRNVIHLAENGNIYSLSPDNVGDALEEYRRLCSVPDRENREYDSKQPTSSKGPQRDASHIMANKYQQHQQQKQQISHHGNYDIGHPHNHHQQQQQPMKGQERQSFERSTDRRKQDKEMSKEEMAREIEELRLRLSSVAGSKLKDGNSSLADLNDPNRPTRIAERYRQLYDDEWTNALEEMMKSRRMKDEKQAILELGSILKETYSITKQLSEESTVRMTKVIKTSLANIANTQPVGQGIETTKSIIDHVKALRKENVDMTISSVEKYCKEHLHKSFTPVVECFAKKCAHLTWLMNIQDPSVVLKWANEGEPFDSKYFNEFTTSGKIVEFTSWPALLIQENGAILAKGTAQPRKK